MTEARREHPLERLLSKEAVEHFRAAGAEMRRSVEAFLPPGVIEHRRAARREFLLGARSLIDASLRRMDSDETG
jgi:hypothetical protein